MYLDIGTNKGLNGQSLTFSSFLLWERKSNPFIYPLPGQKDKNYLQEKNLREKRRVDSQYCFSLLIMSPLHPTSRYQIGLGLKVCGPKNVDGTWTPYALFESSLQPESAFFSRLQVDKQLRLQAPQQFVQDSRIPKTFPSPPLLRTLFS